MDELGRLLAAAADGDRLALSTFVRRTQAEVWRFCAYLVDRDAADDLTQETFLRAMRSAGRFRGESSAKTWLLAIARRVCANEIHRHQRRRAREVTAEVPERGHTLEAGRVELLMLVDTLDPGRRAAFVLTQLLGLTYAETAEACEVPVGTIRSRVARAREDLILALDADRGHASG